MFVFYDCSVLLFPLKTSKQAFQIVLTMQERVQLKHRKQQTCVIIEYGIWSEHTGKKLGWKV